MSKQNSDQNLTRHFRVKLAPELLKKLSVRSNWYGGFSLLVHLLLLVVCCYLSIALFQNEHYVSAFAFLLLYGVFFSFLGWAGLSHELSHNTVFKSRSLNQFVLRVISFFLWNNHVYFSASHAIHHQRTLETGVDFEVKLPIKFSKPLMIFGFFNGAFDFYRVILYTLKNSLNVVEGPLADTVFGRGKEKRKALVRNARFIIIGHITLMAIFYFTNNLSLIIFVCFGNFIAPSFNKVFGLSQHCGMQSDVSDVRLSTRTIILPRFFSFLYWNMNYHIEHHMYPNIPFYQLPILHQNIKLEMPKSDTGLFRLFKLVFSSN